MKIIEQTCDRCVARAYCEVRRGHKKLYFCHHHYRQHKESLIIWATSIIDTDNVVLYRRKK